MMTDINESENAASEEHRTRKSPSALPEDLLLSAPEDTTAEDLLLLANRSTVMLRKIRDEILKPEPRKVAPLVSSTRLQEICGIARGKHRRGNAWKRRQSA